jgi:uncharacterized protein YbaP (TraB family)
MSNRPEEGYLPTALWRIRGPGSTIYLAGVPETTAADPIPFPSPFYAAYRDSQEVLLEFDTDLSWFSQLRMVTRLSKWMKSHQAQFFYPKGKSLTNALPAQTIRKLRAQYGKEFAKQEHMTPTWLVFSSEFESADNEDSSVDDFFAALARKDRKPIRFLQDKAPIDAALLLMDDKISKLNTEISVRGADAVVNEKILGAKSGTADDSSWRRGALDSVQAIQDRMRQDTPAVYKERIVEGNRKWLEKIKGALQGKKNVMVFVDLENLGGKEGLLQLLRDAGIAPEQMYGLDRP